MDSKTSGSTDDARSLAETIESLSRYGQKLPAEEAFELSEFVELLIDKLVLELKDFPCILK